eukprot:7387727-Prymnesium_polylepis.1
MNGRAGVISGWDAKTGRWKVKIDGRPKALALHPQNLLRRGAGGGAATAATAAAEPGSASMLQPWAAPGDDELWLAGFEAHADDPSEKQAPAARGKKPDVQI